MIRFFAISAALVLVLPGCASAAPEERRAYVLAHPHAWVELTISDALIPDVPAGDDSKDQWQRPFSCSLSVYLAGERWFSGSVFPQGEQTPYSAQSGFRFPVPVGQTNLRFTYDGCRVDARERVSMFLSAEIVIEEALVYEVVFDGTHLDSLPSKPNSVVTLEDVYEAITSSRSSAE